MIFEEGIIKTPDFPFDENCGGYGKLLFDSIRKYSDRVALISGKSDDFTTYEDLLDKCVSTAVELRNRGLQRQDLVALCSNRDNLDALIPVIAGQFLGCVTFSIAPALTVEECSELIEQVHPKIIFVTEDVEEKITETFRRCGITSCEIVTFGKQFVDLFLKPTKGAGDFQPIVVRDLKETCLIHFSSGSTGTPKPISLNHYFTLKLGGCSVFDWKTTSARIRQFEGHPIASVSLRYSNWYWVSTTFEVASLFPIGGTILLKDRFDVLDLWKSIEKYHITGLYLTPCECIEMCQSQKPPRPDIASLRELATGGYVLHENYLHALGRLFPGVFIKQCYGMTETGLATTFNRSVPEQRRLSKERPSSCGLPVSGLLYKVVSLETGKKCKANEPGELFLKGKQIFSKFHERDASESFDEEDFFGTGDLVYFDDDFCFYVLDRIKAIIGYKDWVIYPQHIENVVLSHPSVKCAVVIGVPHPTDGERLLGVVELKKETAYVTEQKLLEYVDKRVEDHKRLREGIVFADRIPKTVSGKVQRYRTKRMILDQLHKGYFQQRDLDK